MTDYSSYTHKDLLVALLAEVKGLREDLKPKPAPPTKNVIYAESIEDAFVRAQRQESRRERITVGGQSMPGVHETIIGGLPSELSLNGGDPPLKGVDGADDRGDQRRGVDLATGERMLSDLYDLLKKFSGDWLVGGDVNGGSELGGGSQSPGVVGEFHNASPSSSGCGDTTVGDAAGSGTANAAPDPDRTLPSYGEFLEALQVSNDAADAVMAGTACKWSDDEVKLAEQWVEQYNDALVAALTAELGPLWGDSYLQGVALRAARVGAQLGQGGAR